MRRRTPIAATAAACLGGFALAALSAPPNALPTSKSKVADKATYKSYPVFDAKGRRIGSQKWRLTSAGGNCCEVLITALRNGRLVEFGGTYPIYSDDEGRTWTEIAPAAPSTSRLPVAGAKIAGGEGTVVMAPGGDILGVGWDPYSGDRLQSFFYDHEAKTWSYMEAPLHEPFYDREWNAVAKGPFTINGTKVPWVGLVLSNANREVVLMTTDGLNYFTPTQRDLDSTRNAKVVAYLPVRKDPDMDYMQEPGQTGLAMLPQGALSFDAAAGCKVQTLKMDGTWACFALPNEHELTGPLHTDSRGWLHEVVAEDDEITYRISKNGGRTWTEKTFAFPNHATLTNRDATWDFKVNGKLGLAVIAVHSRKTDDANAPFQDQVMTLDVHSTTPKVKKVYWVGDGNFQSSVGLDVVATVQNTLSGKKSNRVDFTSVAILPNGHIAVSFADKTHDDPAVAILA